MVPITHTPYILKSPRPLAHYGLVVQPFLFEIANLQASMTVFGAIELMKGEAMLQER